MSFLPKIKKKKKIKREAAGRLDFRGYGDFDQILVTGLSSE